jgi:hypothetical protein
VKHAICVIAAMACACSGTTGSGLVTFTALASGPADAVAGAPMSFDTGSGFHVVLTRAQLHIGSIYLNQSVPSSGGAQVPCVLPGIYVAEAFGPLEVDLLSPQLHPFPTAGDGTQTPAKTAEVWLTGGDINASADPTVILSVGGTATRGSGVYPFTGSVTIGPNRALTGGNPGLPGANPICHQRIVTPILVDLLPTNGGTLELRVDPRGMFNALDFSALTRVSENPLRFEIPDSSGGPGGALFRGLLSNAGVYRFSWSG